MGIKSASDSSAPKKPGGGRKRKTTSTTKSSKAKQSTPRKRSLKKTQRSDDKSDSSRPTHRSVPITTVLVMDTGGWTVKHGSFNNHNHGDNSDSVSNDEDHNIMKKSTTKLVITPNQSPNARAKPKHQLALLTADEIHSIHNKGQLDFIRPMERGYVTDLGTQMAIWERILDMEGIATLASSSVNKRKTSTNTAKVRTPPLSTTNATSTAVLLLNQPFTPLTILDREDEIWFRDFGFAKVGRRMIQCMSANYYLSQLSTMPDQESKKADNTSSFSILKEQLGQSVINDNTGCCCVVDSGFSLTHIVPTVQGLAIERAIRRLNVGGKIMTNLLKECISYRQWNIMDEYYIANEAKESLCYLSTNFNDEMDKAFKGRKGLRPFDREFVLPDFVDTVHGFVRLPIGLQKEKTQSNEENTTTQNESDEPDAHNNEKDKNENNNISDDETRKQNENEEGSDSDEESGEQIRKRILKQREEEKRRQELEEQERQVLTLSVERFTVPEVLFRPSDIGIHQLGIAEAIVASINSCKPVHRAAMYHNIILTGGNAKIPNFAERLANDLRKLAPTNYTIRIYCPEDPITYAWIGARQLTQSRIFQNDYFIDNFEWEKSKSGDDIGIHWSSVGKSLGNDFVGI